MSGGKGGSDTTSVEIPQYIEDAARRNLAKADQIAQIGNVVNPGPTSAAFTPMQSSAFQNTADTANAFGMNAPVGQANIQRGGMDEAQQYANGVRGYSSAPIYDQSMEAFGQRDPGQKAFIDSMFLDKQDGGLAYQPSNYGSVGDPFAAQSGYDPMSDVTPPGQAASDAMLDARSRGGNGYGGNGGEMYVDYTPTSMDPYGSPAPSTSGVYTSFGDRLDGGGKGAKGGAYQGGGVLSAGANAATGGDGPGGDGPGGGCVVATHAVESGAFTPHMKREAVVWCMAALHGKWWGEAVRRGYRHLATQKIEQGKAREHYAEFREYIAFANGKKRDLRGALTFITRTAQFFVVGIIKRGA